ncbi:uncharacterized protein IL334_003308 [Kwoniella shivajii]|uniref:Uncharacterized protein n=1 Tax=Kwoniella shivajii TaxID=564305 RepID=A0ABZ1CX80_9TREE|nr:hypothetical protein IL334_003308 [Kwoniella shivajii]
MSTQEGVLQISSDPTIILTQMMNQMNDDFARRRRVYDLLILAIGVAIGILLYSLAHDLIIHPEGCALSPLDREDDQWDLEKQSSKVTRNNLQSKESKTSKGSEKEEKKYMLIDISEKV